jgi:sugar diacid utilization regulator
VAVACRGAHLDHPIAVGERLAALDAQDGALAFPNDRVGWAVGLRCWGALLGYLVVSARKPPPEDARFLLRALAQPTGAAVFNAEAHCREREYSRQLFHAVEEREAANAQLTRLVAELERRRTVHEVLARASVAGEGKYGIARAVYELTGFPTRIEDRFGNLLSWAGPGPAGTDDKSDPMLHDQLLHGAIRELTPFRHAGRLVGLARHRGEVLGTVALVDPATSAGRAEEFTLEYACTALALELAHRRDLAEVELRMRRELVDDLLTGIDEEGAYARAEAVGHDLRGPHHVEVAQWRGRGADDRFMEAVGHAARGLGLRSLLARRSGMAVLIVQGKPCDAGLYEAVAAELGSRQGAVGIGCLCGRTADIPESFGTAVRAMNVRLQSEPPHGTTSYEELGLYRILARGDDSRDVELFVREWLGPLLDYDQAHRTDLVPTLARYFERGGNYDETARALAVHRSTLRYRLQRIQEASGRRLDDVESRFNLQVAAQIWKVSHSPEARENIEALPGGGYR